MSTQTEAATGVVDGPKLMTIGDVLRRIKKSRSVVEWWLRHPEDAPIPFPVPVQINGRSRYWASTDIRKWLLSYKRYRRVQAQASAVRLDRVRVR